MKTGGNGANGNETLNALRAAVIDAVRIRYEDNLKHVDAFDELVFGQPTEELSVAALKYLFAFGQLPYREDVKKVAGKSLLTGMSKGEGVKLADSLSAMQASGEIDCCKAFNGKTAEESAKAVYGQLKLIDKKVGIAGRLVWLRALLNSEHLPNVDIAHPCKEFPREAAMGDISDKLAENADLFAEMVTLIQRGNSPFVMANWIAGIDCSKEARAAMITYLMSRASEDSPRIGMLIDARTGDIASALASAMAGRRSDSRPN